MVMSLILINVIFLSAGLAKAGEPLTHGVGIVGAPFDLGQPKPGVENGPRLLRSFIPEIKKQNPNLKVTDYGDANITRHPTNFKDKIPGHEILKNVHGVAALSHAIYNDVVKICGKKELVVTLGGDHSASIGSIAGLLDCYGEDLSVLWIDAHNDINVASTTKSGNLHGMPLAFVIQELHKQVDLPGFDFIKNRFKIQNLAYAGFRGVPIVQGRYSIHGHNIRAFTVAEFQKNGVEATIDNIVNYLSPNNSRPIHVSFDIDSIDPSIAPSTGTTVPGGLTLDQGTKLLTGLRKTGLVVGFDMMEVNPALGSIRDQLSTLAAANDLLLAILDSPEKL